MNPDSIKFENLPLPIKDKIDEAQKTIAASTNKETVEKTVEIATETFSDICSRISLGIQDPESEEPHAIHLKPAAIMQLTQKQLENIKKPNSTDSALTKKAIDQIMKNVHENVFSVAVKEIPIPSIPSPEIDLYSERLEKERTITQAQKKTEWKLCDELKNKYIDVEKQLIEIKTTVLNDISVLDDPAIDNFKTLQRTLLGIVDQLNQHLTHYSKYPDTKDNVEAIKKSLSTESQEKIHSNIAYDTTLALIRSFVQPNLEDAQAKEQLILLNQKIIQEAKKDQVPEEDIPKPMLLRTKIIETDNKKPPTLALKLYLTSLVKLHWYDGAGRLMDTPVTVENCNDLLQEMWEQREETEKDIAFTSNPIHEEKRPQGYTQEQWTIVQTLMDNVEKIEKVKIDDMFKDINQSLKFIQFLNKGSDAWNKANDIQFSDEWKRRITNTILTYKNKNSTHNLQIISTYFHGSLPANSAKNKLTKAQQERGKNPIILRTDPKNSQQLLASHLEESTGLLQDVPISTEDICAREIITKEKQLIPPELQKPNK